MDSVLWNRIYGFGSVDSDIWIPFCGWSCEFGSIDSVLWSRSYGFSYANPIFF